MAVGGVALNPIPTGGGGYCPPYIFLFIMHKIKIKVMPILDFKPQEVGAILRPFLGFNMEPFWFYGNFCLGGSKFCNLPIKYVSVTVTSRNKFLTTVTSLSLS